MFPKLGIDLGTTNTLVFAKRRGVILNEPSIVALSKHDGSVVAVGTEAKTMVGKTPEDIATYMPLIDGAIADHRITEIMLRHYFKKALGIASLFKPEVMVSVPAGVTSTERRAVIEATLRAGARNVYIVKEPILAALGAGIPIQEPGGHMVIDIGGGTTDIAVISLGGIVASASMKCAGSQLDKAIQQHIKRYFSASIGETTAEEIKIKVGAAKTMPKNEELSFEVNASDFVSELPKSIVITTNEVVRACETKLNEIAQAVKDVLQETPPELAADIMNHGATITGGVSQLRNLPEFIYDKTGIRAHVATDPLFCVAKGTGAALEHVATYKRSVIGKQ